MAERVGQGLGVRKVERPSWFVVVVPAGLVCHGGLVEAERGEAWLRTYSLPPSCCLFLRPSFWLTFEVVAPKVSRPGGPLARFQERRPAGAQAIG